MTRLFSALRSCLGVFACLFLLGFISPLVLYLYVVPMIWLGLKPRGELGPAWVGWVARSLVFFCRLGGAKFETEGLINCAQAGVVIMNHQSVLEIPPLIEILTPRLPRFVARARYARWIPTVSRAIAFLDGIVIDPKADRAGAVAAMQGAADRGLQHAVMVFPEGHRTKDGAVSAFRPAGMVALLAGRQLPVWTIVVDGPWRLGKVIDTFFGLGSVRCRMKVVESVMSPINPEDLPAFIEERRQVMLGALSKMRAEALP